MHIPNQAGKVTSDQLGFGVTSTASENLLGSHKCYLLFVTAYVPNGHDLAFARSRILDAT
jgi:hypothetical protein